MFVILNRFEDYLEGASVGLIKYQVKYYLRGKWMIWYLEED